MEFVKVTENKYFIRLDRGEKVNETLKKFCLDNNIACGKVSAVGALEDIELGYYDYHDDHYDRRQFEDEYELLSMEGNISILKEDTFVHLHVAISDSDYKVYGGHLFEGTVAVTVECWLEAFDASFIRVMAGKESFMPIGLKN